MDSIVDDPLADLWSREAHALRNHVATLRSVNQLVDDPELTEALTSATNALQVMVERSVACARVRLGETPTRVQLPAADLLELATRRARREGADVEHVASGPGIDLVVDVPGAWAERVLADLLHHVAGAPGVSQRGREVVVEVPVLGALDDALAAVASRLAEGCGGALELEDGFARLALPIVSAG